MARKRKIPTRKHHGIRDPLKQLEEREKKLKKVTNHPPQQGNDQKVSFKFAQFKKLVEDTKAGKKLKKKAIGREDKPNESKNTKSGRTESTGSSKSRPVKQFVDETDEDYLKRVNRITSSALKEAQYEIKYGVKVIRNPHTGMISIKKKPKNEIDELLKQKARRSTNKIKKKGKEKKETMDKKTAMELIKQVFKEDKEEKQKEKTELQEYKHDVIRFGEIVHAPPSLTTLPRRAQKNETVPRPGKKTNLLLKSMLNNETENTVDRSIVTKSSKPKNAVNPTKAQLKGKRKDLPATTRTMLETEQQKIIDIYRQLKKQKAQENIQ